MQNLSIAGSSRIQRPKFVIAALLMSLFFGFFASIAVPAWAQTSPKLTLPEIEKRATEARETKQLEQAVALYREGLRLKPNWNEGNWYLGTSLFALKRYPEARDAFRHLAISEPNNAPAWGLAGFCEFELRNYSRALEYLSRAEAAGYGENKELAHLIRFRIALLLNRTGEPKEALDRLIVIAAEGTYSEVVEAMGLSVLRTPLLPSEIPEPDRDLYMRAGEAMHAWVTHDSDGAERLFKELVTAYPDRPNVHYARGAFLLENAPDEALQEFRRELEVNPSNSVALTQTAKLCLRRGAAEEALSYARKAVKSAPDTPVPHRILGESLLETGDTTAAIQELGTAARLAPEHPQTHFLLAEAYKRTGNKLLANKEMAEFQRLDKKEKTAFSNTDKAK